MSVAKTVKKFPIYLETTIEQKFRLEAKLGENFAFKKVLLGKIFTFTDGFATKLIFNQMQRHALDFPRFKISMFCFLY